MSLINKNLISNCKSQYIFGLSNFLPFNYSFEKISNYINYRFYTNYSVDECKELINQINVFNLFSWYKTDEGYDFWHEVDKKQCDYMIKNFQFVCRDYFSEFRISNLICSLELNISPEIYFNSFILNKN